MLAPNQEPPADPRFQDLSGQGFGRLTVLGYGGRSEAGRTRWLCQCSCKETVFVESKKLKSGHTQSCGCLQKERTSEASLVHGETVGGKATTEYVIWSGIKQRCLDENSPFYNLYGGRGIQICDRWLNSFSDFLSDVGRRPSKLHTLDRKNNNGNYEPGNVRWATAVEQGNNRGNNRRIEFNGETMTLTQWGRHLGLGRGVIHHRLKAGLSVKDALMGKVNQTNKQNTK